MVHAWCGTVSFVIYLRYNKKEKKKERNTITQGIRLPQPEMVSSQPLPAASAKQASLPTVNFPAPFTHSLPENTAGQANVTGNSAPPLPIQSAPLPQMPLLPSRPVLIMPSGEGGAAITTPQSRSQYYYYKRKQEKELSGVKSRKYTRSANPIVYGKCGQSRDPTFHKEYFGNWYCKTTVTASFEEWRDNLKSKGYGKNRK